MANISVPAKTNDDFTWSQDTAAAKAELGSLEGAIARAEIHNLNADGSLGVRVADPRVEILIAGQTSVDFLFPASLTSEWEVGRLLVMDVVFTKDGRTHSSPTIHINVSQGVTPVNGGGGVIGAGATAAQVEQLNQNTSDISDIAEKVATLKDRVDGFTHLNQEQRDAIDVIVGETGGARGLIARVLANDAKNSFTSANAATLAEVASRMGRTDEEILEIVATAPANADTMQKLADLLQGQADLNTRIDNLPETPEGITQAHIDAINANTAKTGITAQEQAAIVANTEKVGITATQAAALLKLIDDLEAANLRIDEAEALRRITPQEIADIAALNERVNITPEQADKIAASDAIHADLQAQITAAVASGIAKWNAATIYNTGDLVITDTGIYRAITNNVISATFEPAVGAAWQAGWVLAADAKDASGLDQEQVDKRVDAKLTPDLITQDVIEHADVFLPSATTDFSGVVGTPTHYTQEITITDPQASPNEQGAITFLHTMRAIGAVGSREPLMTFQITQRGAVLFNGRFRDPSDQVMGAFNGYLNEPFQVVEQILWGTDSPSDHYRGEIKLIKSARKGIFYDVVQAAIANATQEKFNLLTHDVEALQTLTNSVGASLQTITETIQGNTDSIGDVETAVAAVRGDIETPVMRAVRGGSIVPTDTPVIEATPLNTELGGDKNFAEQIKDGAIGDETQFLMRITDPTQVLDYGSGRVLDVFNGRVRGFVLVPHEDARTDTETRYITTADGRGQPDNLAVLEFGVGTARTPNDAEVFLTEGIPAVHLPDGQSISNISLPFSVRTNGNWQSIPNTIQLNLRSGEVRSFAIPNVDAMTLTATALTNGQIKVVATHNLGGNPQAVVTNAGAIRFDAGYVLTTNTPEVLRGQRTIDLGLFTGDNVVGFDAIQTGDNAEATAHYVTATGRFDTGYYVLDAHRLSFATDNAGFANAKGESSMLISGGDTALTSEIMGQLDGADEFMGLFVNTTRHLDVLDLGRVVMGRNLKNEPVVFGVEGEGVVATTPTISAFYVSATGTDITNSNIPADLSMATPSLNQGGDMATDGAYTAPKTGVYWMAFRVAIIPQTNNNPLRGGLSIDRETPTEQQDAGVYTSSGSRFLFVQWAGAVALTKGQVVRLQAHQASFAGSLIPDETYFSGYLIGATG